MKKEDKDFIKVMLVLIGACFIANLLTSFTVSRVQGVQCANALLDTIAQPPKQQTSERN